MLSHIRLHMLSPDKFITGTARLINSDNIVLMEFENIKLSPLDTKIQLNKLLNDQSSLLPALSRASSYDERKQLIINFLLAQLAIIFSIHQEDININHSLRDMGIDSLMGLILIKVLENSFNISYSIESLLVGPSIVNLADYILKHSQFSENEDSFYVPSINTSWIAYRERKTRVHFIFCFPYGG